MGIVANTERWAIRMHGTVQGVGFRPFVFRLATRLNLAGEVGNDELGVWCEAEGPAKVLAEFVQRLETDARRLWPGCRASQPD